ncbi:hypothetical protein D3C74_164990 [compost metagenome]
MDTTICPWCQTEIVWDEELGPEEECPHCHNELKGYRTLNINIGASEDELEDDDDYSPDHDDHHNHEHHDHEHDHDILHGLWGEDEGGHLGAIKRVEAFTEAGGDLLAYESGVEEILDGQEEVPECPHCREYMLYAGTQSVGEDFAPVVPEGLSKALLKTNAKFNVYVCSACFSVSRFLSEDDRISLIRNISDNEK